MTETHGIGLKIEIALDIAAFFKKIVLIIKTETFMFQTTFGDYRKRMLS